jgi:type I restriction enzyme S subunit
MSKRNENRPEYKKSKVGWIPEEWTPVKLGSCFKLASGETKPSIISEFPNNQESIPVYGGNGILGYTSQVFDDCKCIIIGRVGEKCGCVHLVNDPHFITDNALYTKAWMIDVSIEYFASFLDYFKLSRLRNKGGQPLVSQKPIYAVTIPLPPLPEQKKIAEILSAWDRAIEQVGKLINAKQRLKKGLMQQLLTGRMRFPEFGKPVQEKGELPEGWQIKPLGSFGSFSKGKGISNNLKRETGLPCITYGEIYGKHEIVIKEFCSFIDGGTAQNSQLISKGDILFAGSGETLDEIGKCVAFTKDIKAYAGGDIVIFRPKNIDSLYLSY